MTELKTLKDFRNLKILLRCTENVAIKKRWFKEGNVGCCMHLKQEAIKWVKDFRKREDEIWESDFMEFFNITEEDLKNV